MDFQIIFDLINFDQNTIFKDKDIALNIENMINQKIIDSIPNTAWQNKRGYYVIEVYAPDCKNKRKQISAKTKELLDKKVAEYYKQLGRAKISFVNVYKEWMNNIYKLEVSGATFQRASNDYKRFYEHSSIVNKPVSEITWEDCHTFLFTSFDIYGIDYKRFTNMRMILTRVLDYSIRKGYVKENVSKGIRIPKNKPNPPKKKNASSKVFCLEEKSKLIEILEQDVLNYKSSVPFAILLNFQLGLRVGELVSLKWSDIDEYNNISISRTETSYNDIDTDFNLSKTVCKVKDSPKTDAGNRTIPLTKKALMILKSLQQWYKENGNMNVEGFIFSKKNGKRITRQDINTCLYSYCNMAEIPRKASHCIRRTVISELIDSDMNNDRVREIAGHSDFHTTMNSYCFDTHEDSYNRNIMETTL